MLVNKEKCRISITELVMLILSIVYIIGIRSWFAECPVMTDMIMSCHWAGEVLKALSILFAVISVIHIVIPDAKLKAGMDIPFIGISFVAIFIPGGIINLCQSADMACQSAAKPWTIIFCAALLVIAIADLIFYASKSSGDKHHRKADQ